MTHGRCLRARFLALVAAAQPAPLPERLLASSAETVVEHALGHWGSAPTAFPPDVRAAYVQALRSPEHAHTICEEYRAAATFDREHDRADEQAGRRIACPLFVLWSRRGALARWFAHIGGPTGMWRRWARHVEGHAIDAGHFFPEETPNCRPKRWRNSSARIARWHRASPDSYRRAVFERTT